MRDEPFAPGPVGAMLDVGGVPVHYLRQGAGRPLVLVHGASGNLNDWRMGATAALAADYDVIAFDRAGLGASGWPGPDGVTLREQARLMRGALGQLGVERATIVGHSYGGSVTLAWALDAPQTVSALVLIAAPSEVWQGGLGLTTDLLANPFSGPALAAALPAVLPRAVAENAAASVFAPQAAPPDYLQRLGYASVVNPRTLRRNAMQLAALKEQIRVMVPGYPQLAMPIELVHGAADTTVPLDIHSAPFAAQAPRARLTRLEGIGHMPHHVALPAVLEAIARVA